MFRSTLASVLVISAAVVSRAPAAEGKATARIPDPPFIIGQVRIQDSKGFDYFYVSGSATMAQMPAVMGKLMGKLEAAIREGRVTEIGAPIAIYTMTKPDGPVSIQVGAPTEGQAKPVGDARVRKVEAKRTASLIYIGPLQNISLAYQALDKAIKEKGLAPGEEWREHYLYWEGQESANNVYMIQATLRD